MNLERGFKRITTLISILVVVVALLLAWLLGPHARQMARYEVDFRGHVVSVTVPESSSDEEIFRRALEVGRSGAPVREAIKHLKESNPDASEDEIITRIARALVADKDTLGKLQPQRRSTWTDWSGAWQVYAATLSLGLIPWAIFFLARWIAHGFKSA